MAMSNAKTEFEYKVSTAKTDVYKFINELTTLATLAQQSALSSIEAVAAKRRGEFEIIMSSLICARPEASLIFETMTALDGQGDKGIFLPWPF
jgi:hypothetical protein